MELNLDRSKRKQNYQPACIHPPHCMRKYITSTIIQRSCSNLKHISWYKLLHYLHSPLCNMRNPHYLCISTLALQTRNMLNKQCCFQINKRRHKYNQLLVASNFHRCSFEHIALMIAKRWSKGTSLRMLYYNSFYPI